MVLNPDASSRRFRREIDRAVHDLLTLFEHEVRAEHIAEHLHTCEDGDSAEDAARRMDGNGFDVLGIRTESEGRPETYGYVRHDDLGPGLCKEYARPFRSSDLIADGTPLIDALTVLRDQDRVFTIGSSVHGIITRADLQKAPVRLLLFGLVTTLEAAMAQVIRREYVGGSWEGYLTPGRIVAAERMLDQRRKRNEEIDLVDCLQLCDKRDILVRSENQRKHLGLNSKRAGEAVFDTIERLRDRLAHSQDLVAGSSWREVLGLVNQVEDLIERLAA